VVSRNLSAFDQAVVSICSMQGGHPGAMSVIPGEVTLVGTVRTYSETVQDLVEERLRQLCTGVAQGFGASAELIYERVYPATDIARTVGGVKKVVRVFEVISEEELKALLPEPPKATPAPAPAK